MLVKLHKYYYIICIIYSLHQIALKMFGIFDRVRTSQAEMMKIFHKK